MTVDDHKALAVRFFEVLDAGNIGALQNIFTEDCIFHRGDLIEPAQGLPGISSHCRKAGRTVPRLPNDNSSGHRRGRFGRHPRDAHRDSSGPVSYTDRHV